MLGKVLLVIGVIITMAGAFFLFAGRLGIGKLPGDIFIQKENFSLYLPLTTGLLISLLLTILLNLFFRR